jgi:hypothetical protein
MNTPPVTILLDSCGVCQEILTNIFPAPNEKIHYFGNYQLNNNLRQDLWEKRYILEQLNYGKKPFSANLQEYLDLMF